MDNIFIRKAMCLTLWCIWFGQYTQLRNFAALQSRYYPCRKSRWKETGWLLIVCTALCQRRVSIVWDAYGKILDVGGTLYWMLTFWAASMLSCIQFTVSANVAAVLTTIPTSWPTGPRHSSIRAPASALERNERRKQEKWRGDLSRRKIKAYAEVQWSSAELRWHVGGRRGGTKTHVQRACAAFGAGVATSLSVTVHFF